MAIEIRKLPKWEEAIINDKLSIIRNSITGGHFLTLSIFSLIFLSLVIITDLLWKINSIGWIMYGMIAIIICFLMYGFSMFYDIRKVK